MDEHRILQNITSVDENGEAINDSHVIRDTCMGYGTAMVVVFNVFCFLRQRFPRPYSVRRWVKDLHTPLANDTYGFFS